MREIIISIYVILVLFVVFWNCRISYWIDMKGLRKRLKENKNG